MKDTIEIPIDTLTELLNFRNEFFKICDEFKIPKQKRGENWIGTGIIERIHTYLTAYVTRRSIIERENGAAFIDTIKSDIQDPVYETPKV